MKHRKDEAPRTWFRSKRIFCEKSEWFIRTREGLDVGPFATRTMAEDEADALQATLEVTRPENVEAAVQGYLLNAQLPADDLGALTDYVVKEGSF
jgi:hypothetical protein